MKVFNSRTSLPRFAGAKLSALPESFLVKNIPSVNVLVTKFSSFSLFPSRKMTHQNFQSSQSYYGKTGTEQFDSWFDISSILCSHSERSWNSIFAWQNFVNDVQWPNAARGDWFRQPDNIILLQNIN